MVDTKLSFPNEKFKKPERSLTSNLNDQDEDESLLRQPLRTSCSGFWEAKKAYENGTDEVRRLLIQECSLIYECNVCRNMFRSLANFISHKRNYCKTTTEDNIHSFPDRNSSVLIKTVECSQPLFVKSRSTGSSPIPNTKSSNRDLSKVIERLKRVEVSSKSGSSKTLTSENKQKMSDPVLELERVSTTSHAVYQTLKTQIDSESIKTELDEVHNLLTNQKTLLGPDGKAFNCPLPFTSPALNDGNRINENNLTGAETAGISCEICKMPFQTEKTLNIHIQKKHSSTTYVFQCPTCSITFLQPAAVIRHLANEHKKPLRRIRKMRDTILKKRIQIGDVQVKGPSRELKRLKLGNAKDSDDPKLFDQQNEKSITSCAYCRKNFERRAALATHLTSCSARKSSLGNVESSNKVQDFSEQFNEAKTPIQMPNTNYLEYNNADKLMSKQQAETKVTIKDEPQEDLNSTTNTLNINELFENLENQTFGSGLQTVSLENVEILVKSKENCDGESHERSNRKGDSDQVTYDSGNNEKPEQEKKVVNGDLGIKKKKSKHFRIVSGSKQLTCRCKICNKQFNALSNLRRHISMFHYRSRRFGCNLCDYRAFRRYDIVNHLTFVHKMTGERESMAVQYVTVHEIKYSKDDVEDDIVVVSDEASNKNESQKQDQQHLVSESKIFAHETSLKTYENREKQKSILLQSNKVPVEPIKVDVVAPRDVSHVKVVRRKLKNSLEQQVEGLKRPIRNRIKTVNKDFVYDLLSIKEESKQPRLAIKRRNTIFVDQNNLTKVEHTPPPIKITPYRLRTEPLMPADKTKVKGVANNICRNVIHEGLAALSTLPELPAERPQMRPRHISSLRNDSNSVTVIETSDLEAARLKSTFFDDSFLEKFAKKLNPSFKMKPLLALQHSPLNSILQKFDTTQQHNIHKTKDSKFQKPPEKHNNSPLNLIQHLTQSTLSVNDVTPNGKQILKFSSPPSTPTKRITLMQRLAENRAKRRDSLIRNSLEN